MTTTNTLTTSGAGIKIKSDLVLVRGLGNCLYMDTHSSGVLFYDDDYMDAILKVQNGFSIGTQAAADTWTQQFRIAAKGNMTTSENHLIWEHINNKREHINNQRINQWQSYLVIDNSHGSW